MADEYIIQLRITGPERSEVFVVPAGASTIGRQEGNSLRLDHSMISRQHARLDCTATGCQITDLGSANGTLVNGERLAANAPVPLAHGAVIEIGPFRLAYEQIPVAPAVVAEPAPAKPKAAPRPRKAAPEAGEVKMAEPAPGKVEGKVKKEVKPLPSVPPVSRLPARPPEPDYSQPPPGLSHHSQHLIEYLPGIYQNDFMERFLAIFESIWGPIQWNVDNFDLYLSPGAAPDSFLPWLAGWFELTFDSTWSAAQRRTLLSEAHDIYARRGTRWALSRVLEIYTGSAPEIIDAGDGLEPFTFTVKLPLAEDRFDVALIQHIIDAHKPAHTTYRLEFEQNGKGGGRARKR